ncbi:Uncharacterized transporter HI_0883 [Chlamydiales bacterium SCGC AB-751-O23]|jgi:alanine or glycine:cation symporter, AGCS family|nr:Uncharacterized transporter HI_0883 [Chlamydiales bacterium SCGC AB-751-O23]
MLNYLSHGLGSTNYLIASFIIFPLIIALGIYLSVILGPIQITLFKEGFLHLLGKKKRGCKKHISSFEALLTVLAGNLGTGNISGMAVALATGGPGALPWMWVMAFLGAIIKYSGCVLGLKYREKKEDGSYVGGPMYYLDKGLGWKKMAIVFSISSLFCALTVGNLVQVNSISLPATQMGIPKLYFGLLVAILVGMVILGGARRIIRVITMIVPFMTLVYLGCCLFILWQHADQVLPSIKTILISSINFKAASGGFFGFGIMKVISIGFERGVFATDAGLGIAPVLQSGIKTENKIIEGVVAMMAPLVVMVICSLTFLVLMVSQAHACGEESTNMCVWAFKTSFNSTFAGHIVTLSLFFFAFTTIIAWYTCSEKVLYYLFKDKYLRRFKFLFILIVPLGALMQSEFVWLLADFFISIMLITNVLAVIGLSSEIIADSKEYLGISEESS